LYGGLGGHVAVAMAIVDGLPNFRHRMLFYGIDLPADDTLEQCRRRGIEFSFVQKDAGLDLKALASVYDDLVAWDSPFTIMHSLTALPAAICREDAQHKVLVVDHTSPAAKSRNEWLASQIAALTIRLVFLTPEGRDALLARFGRLVSRVTIPQVIPNGVDTTFYSPQIKPVRRDVFRVTMMARFCKERDFLGLVKAIELLKKRRPEHNIELILAGDGRTRLEVETYVKRRGIDSIVKLPGQLNEAEVLSLLRETDVYVQWSLADSLSTSVMQAMACAVPVIATKIPGMGHLVEDQVTGFLLPRTTSALIEGLESLANQKALRKRFGQNGRVRVERRFSHLNMAHAYLVAFENA